MYTTCVVWLAFVPLYFGTFNSFQVSQCLRASLLRYLQFIPGQSMHSCLSTSVPSIHSMSANAFVPLYFGTFNSFQVSQCIRASLLRYLQFIPGQSMHSCLSTSVPSIHSRSVNAFVPLYFGTFNSFQVSQCLRASLLRYLQFIPGQSMHSCLSTSVPSIHSRSVNAFVPLYFGTFNSFQVSQCLRASLLRYLQFIPGQSMPSCLSTSVPSIHSRPVNAFVLLYFGTFNSFQVSQYIRASLLRYLQFIPCQSMPSCLSTSAPSIHSRSINAFAPLYFGTFNSFQVSQCIRASPLRYLQFIPGQSMHSCFSTSVPSIHSRSVNAFVPLYFGTFNSFQVSQCLRASLLRHLQFIPDQSMPSHRSTSVPSIHSRSVNAFVPLHFGTFNSCQVSQCLRASLLRHLRLLPGQSMPSCLSTSAPSIHSRSVNAFVPHYFGTFDSFQVSQCLRASVLRYLQFIPGQSMPSCLSTSVPSIHFRSVNAFVPLYFGTFNSFQVSYCIWYFSSFAYPFLDVAALTDLLYIRRCSAVLSTLQTLADISSPTNPSPKVSLAFLPLFLWPLILPSSINLSSVWCFV